MTWESLLAVYHEAAAEREAHDNEPPASCPNDGEPLGEGPDGQLVCPFDGWVWNGQPIRYS